MPYIIAFFAHQKPTNFSERLKNHGDLIMPPVSIRLLKLTNPANGQAVWQSKAPRLIGKWVLMTVNFGPCKKACETALYNMRQVRTATGKEQNRVLRVILTGGMKDENLIHQLSRPYHGTAKYVVNKATYQHVMKKVAIGKLKHNGTIYLVDPLGNIMMVYAPDTNNSGIYKDLKHLLKTSQIG